MRLKTPITGDEATDDDVVAFLNWVSHTIFLFIIFALTHKICAMCIASLYPGSPFSRKILPLELYSLMVDVWQVDEAEKNAPSYLFKKNLKKAIDTSQIQPLYSKISGCNPS